MLRRIFFGLPKVTVRIAAISHRTEWRISHGPGQYVGLELGAEVFPLLDLDEFVVFPARSRELQTRRRGQRFRSLAAFTKAIQGWEGVASSAPWGAARHRARISSN